MSAPAVSAAAPKNFAVLESQFRLRQHVNQDWCFVAPHGVTREQLLDPACWANIAAQLTVNDTIIVIPESGEYRAELIVTETGKSMARTRVLRWNALVDDEDEARTKDYALVESAGLSVKWSGPSGGKWRVIRNSDKACLFRDLVTKDEAYSRALEYMTG